MQTVMEILAALIGMALIVLLMAFPVMWLWNWLMPNIFGLIAINIWESAGMMILLNLLFNTSNSSSKD